MRTLVQNKYNENIGILKIIKQIAKTFLLGNMRFFKMTV